MIDTHSHIYLPQFERDLQEVLDRAFEAGITDIYMPAINRTSINDMNSMHHPRIRFHKMAGVHPCEIGKSCGPEIKESRRGETGTAAGPGIKELHRGETGTAAGPDQQNRRERSDWLQILEGFLDDEGRKDQVVAIGETGLDYYWSVDQKIHQQASLTVHCRMAKTLNKPVILHNRQSTEDLLDIVAAEQDGNLRGIWHCFNGTYDEARRAMDLNLHLGIGGVVTYKNAGVDRVVAGLPPDRILLETDAPYLAPVPRRGKRNEPAYLAFTAKKVSQVMGIPVEELDRITTENARRLFHPGIHLPDRQKT